MIAAAVAGFAAFLSLVLTLGVGIVLVPDTERYVSGLSLVGPLSTGVGSVGVESFAALQAFSTGVLVWLVVRARPSWWSVAWAAPVLLWMVPLGADVVSGLLLVGVLALRGRSRLRAFGLLVLSAGYHLAALGLGGLLALPRSRRYSALVLLVLVVAGLLLLSSTEYGRGLVLDPRALAGAVVTAVVVLALGLGPYIAGAVPITRAVVALGLGTALVSLYAAQSDLHGGSDLGRVIFAGTRYALPLVLWALVCPRMGESERPKTALGGGYPKGA